MSERRFVPSGFPTRVVALITALVLSAAASLPAQDPPPASVGPGPRLPGGEQSVRLMVFALHNQRALDALVRVRPLLSARGSVTLDEGANTISVRDTPAALSRVAVALREIDHAPRDLAIEIQLIRALTSQVSPTPPSSGFDAALLGRMKQLFRFESFVLLARGRIATREGEAVDFEMGDGYRLTFRPGTVVDERRLKLGDFRMLRATPGAPPREVVKTIVNLRSDQPLILGLTRDEAAGSALLLAMRFDALRPVAASREPAG